MKYKIFVSGVQKELKEERHTIKEYILNNALLKEYFEVFLFEDYPARGRPSESVYLEEVRRCDIYIGILGKRYGSLKKEGISPTEREFREAQRMNKEILIYIKGHNGKNDLKRDKGIQKLIKEIETQYTRRRFNTTDELNNLVFESLVHFLREKGIVGRSAFDESICPEAKLSDIDEGKIRWFLRIARERRKFSLSLDSSIEDVLTHLNLIRQGKLTNAAVLLFGKDPHKFFLQAEIKCIQFPGTEIQKPFTSYQIYNGNLFEQIDKSVAFVLDAIKFPVIQQEHTVQVKRPYEIPVFAIQEAIVNAVAHRDYNTTSGVQVMVFVDRVEIWNSGSLPSQLSIEDLKKPHTSFPNNPLLANALYLADYIQKAGSGTLEMIKQCRAQGLPEPEFISIRNVEFRTILGRDIFTENVLTKLGLNERQIRAVKYVKEKGQISNQIYQKINNTTKRTASRDLTALVLLRVFKKTGVTGKGTIYMLRGHKGDIGDNKGTQRGHSI